MSVEGEKRETEILHGPFEVCKVLISQLPTVKQLLNNGWMKVRELSILHDYFFCYYRTIVSAFTSRYLTNLSLWASGTGR